MTASLLKRFCRTSSTLPALIALVQAPDGSAANIHRTFLDPAGRGKANISTPRAMMPGDIPSGSAVRLFPVHGERLGIAEGTQAQTVRETLGEGLTSIIPKERRIASLLLNEFDDWAAPVMPGADAAREVSSRYIRGQQLENLTDRAIGRGRRLRGSDDAAQVRTLYGQLDEKIGQGQAFFDTPTAEQISRVAQGDRLTNALRWIGKFSPQNVMPARTTAIRMTMTKTSHMAWLHPSRRPFI